MDVSLVFLTLNEYEGFSNILPQIDESWYDEAVVIDGGSTDGTIEYAEEQGIRVVQQADEGRGNAFRTAVRNTTGEIIVYFSPDGNETPSDIPKLVERIEAGCDMVIAARFGEGRSEDATSVRWAGNLFFTELINLLFGGELSDAVNGFRAVTRSCMVDLDTTAKYFDIEIQMTMRALLAGYEVCEIPTVERERIGGEAKLSTVVDGSRYLLRIAREYISHRL